jgi:hypothetical protein
MKGSKQIFIGLLTLVILLSGISLAGASSAWKNPTATPPGNNIDAPINVGTDTQDKAGALRVTGFRSFFDAIFDTKVEVGTTGNIPSALNLLVHGKVGAGAYCDENGQNCVTSTGIAVASSTSSSNTSGTVKVFDTTVPLGTVLNNGTYSVAHGLGKTPNLVKVTLVNVSPEAGYSPGDEVEITGWYYSSVTSNATNVIFNNDKTIVAQRNNSFSINNYAGNWVFGFCPQNGCDTSASVGHNGKWKMRFQAFLFQ